MVWKSGQSCSSDLRRRVLAEIDGGSPARLILIDETAAATNMARR
jgi:hypothetical protein